MTKSIRIENADTTNYVVVVEEWIKTPEGDKLIQTHKLSSPCQLLQTYICFDKYFVIKEGSYE